ncbi:MAG: prolyl oligopeptidase family serine peptidase [Dehalococcoidia bacterium]
MANSPILTSNVQDLIAAADYLTTHHQAPRILIGHSLGGTAVLASAKDIPEAKAVATIGAPFEPAELKHLLPRDALEAINSAGTADVSIGGRIFHIKKQFLEDINEQNMTQNVAGLGKALLVFHSPNDEIVRPENADKIYQAARHPKSLVSLDDADHLLTRKEDAEYVAVVLSAWASRYIDGRETKP